MKTFNLRVFCLIVLQTIFLTGNGQLIVKKFSNADSRIGGECKLLNSSIEVKGDVASKTFEIEVFENGNYFLNILQNYSGNKKIKVKVDDVFIGVIESTKKEGLELYRLSEESAIKLTKGKHLIKFELENYLIPQIDYISLSIEADKPNFDLTTIKNEENELKSKDLKNYNKEEAKKAWFSLCFGGPEKIVNTVTGFPKSYNYALDINYKYTYFSSFYFTPGQLIILETFNSNCDPVMELVSADGQYSWVNDDYNGYESRIDVTIPVGGVYYMRVRPFYSNATGISNVKFNNNTYATNIPIQWTYVNIVNQASDGIVRNYFTAKHNGEDLGSYDTFLWIEDATTLPGKILALNDDYSSTGDFDWILTSRIKKSFTSTIRAVWVNAYSQFVQSTCDVYLKAPNSTIMSHFENLNADDAIESAPADDVYNCISWSGGIYTYWEWPDNPGSNFYDNVNHDPLTSFDHYFGNEGNDCNPRYGGAVTFYRLGEDNENAVIDLYGYEDGDFTHASVKNSVNFDSVTAVYIPNGYDWESKPGELMRSFHQRESLIGEEYGNILYHYAVSYNDFMKSPINSLSKSVRLGLSVIDNESFSETEKMKIRDFKTNLNKLLLSEFETKYNNWKTTWKSAELKLFSNPKKFAESKEYFDLLNFCKIAGKVTWVLIAEKLNEGDLIAWQLLMELTLKDNSNLLDKVHSDNRNRPLNEDGAVLVRSIYSNSIKYTKYLLTQEKIFEPKEKINVPMILTVSVKPFQNQLKINITVEKNLFVNIEVYDLSGKFYKSIISNYECIKGLNTNFADIADLNRGIYICKISGEYEKIAKFIVQ